MTFAMTTQPSTITQKSITRQSENIAMNIVHAIIYTKILT